MDHDEIVRGGPELDRQERPVPRDAEGRPLVPRDAEGRPLVPQRIPETRPTPLQDAFIPLSVVVLVCGVIAISALELGARLADVIVRLPALVGGVILAIVTIDAIVRIWRSAWAWLPVDRGRGLFRFVWVAVLVISRVLLGAALWLVVRA